jgi:hypothetical protein
MATASVLFYPIESRTRMAGIQAPCDQPSNAMEPWHRWAGLQLRGAAKTGLFPVNTAFETGTGIAPRSAIISK